MRAVTDCIGITREVQEDTNKTDCTNKMDVLVEENLPSREIRWSLIICRYLQENELFKNRQYAVELCPTVEHHCMLTKNLTSTPWIQNRYKHKKFIQNSSAGNTRECIYYPNDKTSDRKTNLPSHSTYNYTVLSGIQVVTNQYITQEQKNKQARKLRMRKHLNMS